MTKKLTDKEILDECLRRGYNLPKKKPSGYSIYLKDNKTGKEYWVDSREVEKIGKTCSVCGKILETEKDWDKHAKRHPGHFIFPDGVV